jgi:hypothetical protein
MEYKEIWKKIYIDGKETIYMVSNTGKIRNIDTARDLKAVPGKRKGYPVVYLRISKGKYKRFRVHHLVAMYFVENDDVENKTHVDHLDGNKMNNNADNLEWVTPKENVHRAFKTGLHPVYTCEEASHAQKSNEEIDLLCRFMVAFPEVPLKKVARMFEVSYATIQNIRLHRQWVEISSKYDFPPIHDVHRSNKISKEIDKMLLAGYDVPYVVKHFNFPDNYTDKMKYNTVYYRKQKLQNL